MVVYRKQLSSFVYLIIILSHPIISSAESRDYTNFSYQLSTTACDVIRGGAFSLYPDNPPDMTTHHISGGDYLVKTSQGFYDSKVGGNNSATYTAATKTLTRNYRDTIGDALISRGDTGVPLMLALVGGAIPGFGQLVGGTLTLYDAWLRNGSTTKGASYVGNLMKDGGGRIVQVVTFHKDVFRFVTRSYIYSTNIDGETRLYLLCSTTLPLEIE